MRHYRALYLVMFLVLGSAAWATSRSSTPVLPGKSSYEEADIGVTVALDPDRAVFNIVYRAKKGADAQHPPEAFLDIQDASGKAVAMVPVQPHILPNGAHYGFTLGRAYCDKSALSLAPRTPPGDNPPSGLSFRLNLGEFERAQAATEPSSRSSTRPTP